MFGRRTHTQAALGWISHAFATHKHFGNTECISKWLPILRCSSSVDTQTDISLPQIDPIYIIQRFCNWWLYGYIRNLYTCMRDNYGSSCNICNESSVALMSIIRQANFLEFLRCCKNWIANILLIVQLQVLSGAGIVSNFSYFHERGIVLYITFQELQNKLLDCCLRYGTSTTYILCWEFSRRQWASGELTDSPPSDYKLHKTQWVEPANAVPVCLPL